MGLTNQIHCCYGDDWGVLKSEKEVLRYKNANKQFLRSVDHKGM